MACGESRTNERLCHIALCMSAGSESPYRPESPCFRKLEMFTQGWEGGRLLLASVVLKKEWHVGASTTERPGCSTPGGAFFSSSQPPRHFQLLLMGRDRTSDRSPELLNVMYTAGTKVRDRLWGSQVWVPLSLSSPKRKDMYEVSPSGSDPAFVQSQGISDYPLCWGLWLHPLGPHCHTDLDGRVSSRWFGSHCTHMPFLRDKGFLGWTGCG